MLIAVLANTHLHPGRGDLPVDAWRRLAGADLILHAGDVVTPDLLDRLGALAPVHTVLGNNDHGLVGVLPERLEVDLGGVTVGMVHDSGTRAGRAPRMRRWFPDADVVVFGHSHEPLDDVGLDGQRLFNPGSPTQRRRAPSHTMGELEVADGRLVAHRIVTLG